ncbi:ceramidase domain-containing protein [Halovulum sp. GXIMD14794]
MNWTQQVDNYCERLGPGFWAEPLNAITNAAFIIAALVVWAILGGKRDPGARVLTVILFAIGVGSFLFHTYATRWAGAADVLPILLFILVYIYLATRRFFEQGILGGAFMVALFFPFSWAVTLLVGSVTGPLNGSLGYVPVPVLILIYAAILWRGAPLTARGLAIGAGILLLSLFFRSIDEAVCSVVPIGTHFLWHSLNALMLGWMILVLHTHLPPERREA